MTATKPTERHHGTAECNPPKLEFTVRPPLPWRRRLLHGFQAGLQRTGIADAFVRATHVCGAVVLMYHSVAAEDDAVWIDPRNHLAPETFARHVAFLARYRRVISLESLCESLDTGRQLERGSVVITFDDGYRDNWTIAAPLLRQAGLPATLFLATGYVERGENQWIDQLYAAFTCRTRDELTLDGCRFELRNAAGARSAYEAAAAELLQASIQRRDKLLECIRDELQPSVNPPRLTLTWDEVKHLQEDTKDMSFGLHTRDHVDLTGCEESEVRAELSVCRDHARRHLGEIPCWFSFPYSRSSAESIRLVREAGFRQAFTREAAELITQDSDTFALPRVVAPASLSRLAFITGGAYPRLSRALVGRA